MKHIFDYLEEAFKEHFEERAAIREFDGNQTREDAEKAAQIEIDNHRAMRENVARDSGANK